MTANVPALIFDRVDFSYGQRPVLGNVSLRVEQGEFVALVGPNGGGKSTLLKLALGLIEPDRGQIRVFGVTPKQARSRLGYVPQFATFRRDFPLSVRETVLH
ncbi:MAG: ATP-binding cassette domain-containing protein, partial [Candidatus Oleimicrobiaceae bacterium]